MKLLTMATCSMRGASTGTSSEHLRRCVPRARACTSTEYKAAAAAASHLLDCLSWCAQVLGNCSISTSTGRPSSGRPPWLPSLEGYLHRVRLSSRRTAYGRAPPSSFLSSLSSSTLAAANDTRVAIALSRRASPQAIRAWYSTRLVFPALILGQYGTGAGSAAGARGSRPRPRPRPRTRTRTPQSTVQYVHWQRLPRACLC